MVKASAKSYRHLSSYHHHFAVGQQNSLDIFFHKTS